MAELTFQQKDAFTLLKELFASYGLGSDAFVEAVKQAILDNTDAQGNVASASAAAAIRATDVYKARFAGNELRKKRIQEDMARGVIPSISELTESSYLALEDSYRNELRKYNVPPQFYDDTSYLAKMIGNDLSTAEVGARASLAQQAANLANPEIKQQLKAFYGVGEDQIAAFFLDPELGKQTIDTVAAGNAAILAASAERAGMALTQAQAENLATISAPDRQSALNAQAVFAQTSATAGLSITGITGEQSTIGAEDVILAATGDAERAAKLERERQRRLAQYRASAGSELGRTATGGIGVTSLQTASQ